MTYTYTTRDGQRVEVHVAAAYDKLNAAFQAANGCSLGVTSGTRTRAQQTSIFMDRYTTSPGVRTVYDRRNWQGRTWYRVSAAGTVALPGTSNHEDDGPIGPRALDLHDTGEGPGVNVRGSKRDLWMRDHAPSYGFTNAGYGFGEAWHKEYQGSIGGPLAAPVTQPAVLYHGRELVRGCTGPDVKSMQQFFIDHLHTTIIKTADGSYGPATETAVKVFQKNIHGSADGRIGPQTGSALVWRGWKP